MLSSTIIPEVKEWIALDIDETLSRTIWYLVSEMQKKFWNPENLSAEKLIAKYRYTQHVPYWQSDEAKQRIHDEIHSSALQEELPMIEWAKQFVNKINKIIPITAYITVRPTVVFEWTKKRLQKNWFPQAPIIMKPESIKKEQGNEWKAKVLEKLYPKILGIIDDNDWLVDYIGHEYKWSIFLYSHNSIKQEHKNKNVIACKSRHDVYNEIKKQFEYKKTLQGKPGV